MAEKFGMKMDILTGYVGVHGISEAGINQDEATN